MEEQTAGDSPPAYHNVVPTPMSFLQAALPEYSENTKEQETGDEAALIPPDRHQPHEPPLHFQTTTYTEPPPAYSLHATHCVAAPSLQQQNQQHRHQQVVTCRPTVYRQRVCTYNVRVSL